MQLHKSLFMMQSIYLPRIKTGNHLTRCYRVIAGLILSLTLFGVSQAQTPCSELFFSEYVEGSGSANKALEVYNPSSDSIDLANYQIQVFRNGDSEPTDVFALEGTIAPGGTVVICNNNAEFESCQLQGGAVMTFNGDDALSLFNISSETIIDVIGVIGDDPGSSWPVGDGSTQNNTLVRINTVTEGTTDWSVGETQWSILEIDDVSGLGSHDFDQTACDATSEECTAAAGTLTAAELDTCFAGDPVTISATPNGDQVVPEGYSTLYVLTQGNNLIIQSVNEEPTFEVASEGLFTIHTLIYNGDSTSDDFLDLSIVVPGETSGVDVLNLVTENDICASLDVAGAPFDIQTCSTDTCLANAGTMTADPFGDKDCLESEEDSIIISATPNGDANVPEGYELLYVLTTGESLVITNTGDEPSFTVQGPGRYTIHTLVYVSNPELNDFLDLGIVVPGETTGGDVLDLIKETGICASLDATGAPFDIEVCTLEDTCTADAGTLTAVELTEEDCIDAEDTTSTVTISATPNGDAVVPEGYSTLFVLTSTDSLVIQNVADTPSFEVTEAGLYTIHTLIYNGDSASDDFLDLSVVVPGETKGGDVLAIVEEAGICASLDVAGAAFNVTACEDAEPAPNGLFFSEYVEGSSSNKAIEIYNGSGETVDLSNYLVQTYVNGDTTARFEELLSGTLEPGDVFVICNSNIEDTSNCDITSSVANFNGDDAIALINVSNGDTLDIIGVSGEDPGSEWEVVDGTTQNNTIIRFPEVTEGTTDWTQGETEWFALPQDEFDSLGFHRVVEPSTCTADAGTLEANALTAEDCIDIEDTTSTVTISATPSGDAVVPEGYSTLFVLTSTDSLVIQNVADTPSFEVNEAGRYTIHTLIYNGDSASDDFLGLSVVVPGETKGGDVLALVEAAGICASLDVAGAAFDVVTCSIDTCDADAGTLTAVPLADADTCFDGSQITLEATPNGDIVVPDGYSVLYVLTRGEDLVIQRVNTEPVFDIAQAGIFTIHTLVYNADSASDDFLDLSVVVPGETTGGDVLGIVTENDICASLDVAGARFNIPVCPGTDDCPEVCVLRDWKDEGEPDNGFPLNHAIYLYTSPLDPNRENGNDTDFQRFVWESEGTWTNYGDSAIVTGTVVSKVDSTAKFEVFIKAINPQNWEEWSAGGGTFMAQSPEAAEAAEQNFTDWMFYIISSESKLTGTGSLEGIELMLSHVPVDFSKGLQVGIGANDKDGSFGISGWFSYTGEFAGRRIGAAGDINADFDLESCKPAEDCGEIIAPTIVGDISTRVLPTQVVEVNWEVVTPQIYAMANNITVERSVNGGSFEAFAEEKADAFRNRYTFYDERVVKGQQVSYRVKTSFKDGTAGISQNALLSWESSRFEAYPNPVSNILSIRAINPSEGDHLIRVYDINGREVLRKTVSDFRRDYTIDMSDMGRSLYILHIAQPSGEVQTMRISVK